MIDDFSQTLAQLCRFNTAFIGVGNTDRSDDGAGVVCAELLKQANVDNVFIGGSMAERTVSLIRERNFHTVVFIDALDAGLEPGAITLLNTGEIVNRYPQVSTHKLSIGTLATMLDGNKTDSIWLIGIQPETISFSDAGLTTTVATAVRLLAERIINLSITYSMDAVSPSAQPAMETVCN